MLQTELLISGRVGLIPLAVEEQEYLVQLIQKDERSQVSLSQIQVMMTMFCKHSWRVMYNGFPFGVGLALEVNGQWILEGLKDKSVKGVPFSASIEAGKLMRDFLFRETEVLFTYARVEQRAIQYLCEKLGFRNIGIQNGLVMYRKEKVCQSSGQ